MGRKQKPIIDDLDNGWATVIALDPGGTTGWSVMCVYADSLVDDEVSILRSIAHRAHGQINGTERQQCTDILDLIAAWPYAAVVIESFTLRKFTMSSELLSPVRIGAVIEYALWRGGLGVMPAGRPLFWQSPALAKKTATDERLREWKLWERDGEQHARDADRHAITFLRSAKGRTRIRAAAWPWRYDKNGNMKEDV